MKKSLLALAVLGAFAGVASAQSSVTLSGTVDVNGRYIKNGGVSQYQLGSGSLNSDQLVFSGIEDLGGGLKAGFVLNSQFAPDTGTTTTQNVSTSGPAAAATTQTTSQFFNRRATLSLISATLGEVRLGRDYVPTFWNPNRFDPFGVVGTANLFNVFTTGGGKLLGTTVDAARADNSVGYFLPAGLGGIYGQAMVAAGENGGSSAATSPDAKNNKYAGGRLGFASGPIDVAAAYGRYNVQYPAAAYTAISATAYNNKKLTVAQIAGSYDFGIAKFTGQLIENKYLDRKQDIYALGAIIPLGQGEIHASYAYNNNKLSTATQANLQTVGWRDQDDSSLFGLGYVYNLSKRTALYAQGARIKNKNGAAFSVTGTVPFPTGVTSPSSNGAEFGIRHFF